MGVTRDATLGVWLALGWDEMWVSTDGEIWQRHAFIGEQYGGGRVWPAYMVDVTRHGGRLWAAGTLYVGSGDSRALLIWSSTDGENWEIEPQDGFTYSVSHGLASNGSVLAVSSHYFAQGTGAVLTSTNGQSWTEHQPGGFAGIQDIYGDSDGFVAVGYRSDDSAFAPVIWASADGTEWADVSPGESQGYLRSVVRSPDGSYLAAGSGERGSLAVWRSEDMANWVRVGINSPPLTLDFTFPTLPTLAASDSAVILVTKTTAGSFWWASEDGLAWTEGQALPAEIPSGFSLVSAIFGDRLIVFDERSDGQGSHQWVGHLIPLD